MADITLQLDAMINDLHEGLQVEVKNWLNGLVEAVDKARLAKEIIALANAGGGFIFIGFDDAEPHAPIVPGNNDQRGYTQDSLAGIVNAYLTPPCQCELRFLRQIGGNISHPVIIVPGEHRTPVFAARGAPENGILDNGKVYVRRPGGNSEHARTQDDWERLIDRLVKARQADQLNAIRGILNPNLYADPEPQQNHGLDAWIVECLARWQARIANLAGNDPRRFTSGYWHVAFRIHPFSNPTLVELSSQLDQRMPKYSGWPPFTFLHREDRRPQPFGNSIEAWLGEADNGELSDYWRISRDGYAFLLRPMQEDQAGYGQNVFPGPPNRALDWVLPIYRMTEVLRQLESLAANNGSLTSRFDLKLTYENTEGRYLWRRGEEYFLGPEGPCRVGSLTSHISANVAELEFNLNEVLWRLLQPIHEQFNFAVLTRALVDSVVAKAHDYRRQFGR